MKNTLLFLAIFSTGIMASESPLPPDELLILNPTPEALFVDAVTSNDSNIVGWGLTLTVRPTHRQAMTSYRWPQVFTMVWH